MTSADRIRNFLAMLDAKPLRGADPEVIYAIHTGTEFEAELRKSDLRALLGDTPAPATSADADALLELADRLTRVPAFARRHQDDAALLRRIAQALCIATVTTNG